MIKEDEAGPMVFSSYPGDKSASPTLVVPSGDDPSAVIKIKTEGKKVVFWLDLMDDLESDPESITAASDASNSIKISSVVPNVHYTNGIRLKVGVSSEDCVAYPGELSVRVYEKINRSVLFAHPYFGTAESPDPDDPLTAPDGAVFYLTGNAERRDWGEDALAAWLEKTNSPYNNNACIFFAFADPKEKIFSCDVEGAKDDPGYAWDEDDREALSEEHIDGADHVVFPVNVDVAGRGDVRGPYSFCFPSRTFIGAHEFGHNLGIPGHTDDTVMNNGDFGTRAVLILQQLKLIDEYLERDLEYKER